MVNMDKDTVFVRTEMGQNEAYDPASDMPRVLRTLLFSIDGRSTAGNYAALLPNFGDVHAHLDLLHEAGYIRVSRSRSKRVASVGTTASAASDTLSSEMRSTQFESSSPPRTLPQDSRWPISRSRQPAAGTRPPAAPLAVPSPGATGVGALLRRVLRLSPREDAASRAWGQSQQFANSAMPGAADTTARPETQPHQRAAPVRATPVPQQALLSEAARLHAVRELMIDFLHLHLPAIAQEASMSIEALHTSDQMMRSLPDYSHLVSRTGDPGAAHLAQLHLTLGLISA
jgi:hypothetical protein